MKSTIRARWEWLMVTTVGDIGCPAQIIMMF